MKPESSNSSKSSLYRKRSAWERIGWFAIATLLSTTIAILVAFGFLAFLWLSNHNNHLWHKIMVTEWATRSVTITTLVLRFVTDCQAGIIGSMLAALIIESYSVCLYRSSEVSIMRASSPRPRMLLELIPAMTTVNWSFGSSGAIIYAVLVTVLVATMTALQFSSTILLSDLRLGQLPSPSLIQNATYDFTYTQDARIQHIAPGLGLYQTGGGGQLSYPLQARTSTWLRNPPAFPTFAEYSRPLNTDKDIDDTGVLLRAFLPFSDAQSRESIRNYSGNAMVLDSRVSCQRPVLHDIRIGPIEDGGMPYLGRVAGTFEPSKRGVEGLWAPADPLPFNCTVYLDKQTFVACQVTAMNPMTDSYSDNGGLMSEFWQLPDPTKQFGEGVSMWSLPLLVFQLHNDSTTTDFDENITSIQQDSGYWTQVITSRQTWNVSICYSSWTTADLHVDMYSNENRSEPKAFWNAERGFYTQPDIHSQLGDTTALINATPESRGILQLGGKASWIPDSELLIPNQVQPFVQQFADVTNQQVPLGIDCDHCSALFAPAFRDQNTLPTGVSSSSYYDGMFVYAASTYPSGVFLVDSTLSSIVQQSLAQTGSMARALSSLITLMSGMAYYDQMPQFQQQAKTEQTFFSIVLYPQSKMGFWAFGIVLAVHVSLVIGITTAFIVWTRHTLLGNYWQAVAQILSPDTQTLLDACRNKTDADAKEIICQNADALVRVGLRVSTTTGEEEAGLKAVSRKQERSSKSARVCVSV